MGRPNANNLPEHLRKGADGAFILDYFVTLEDGSKKRVLKSLGKIPKVLALVTVHGFLGGNGQQ